MPDEPFIASETPHTVSEPFGNESRFVSEPFRNNPSASETNINSFPKASEPFRNEAPVVSETKYENLSHPPRQLSHTLTVREVEKLFEQSGRPVTERSILNWCKPNREGVCRLNCGYDRGENRWYIAPASVERVIEEERQKNISFPKESLEFSETSDRLSESFGNESEVVSESFGTFRKETENRFGNKPHVSETRPESTPAAAPAESRESHAPRVDTVTNEERDSLLKRVQELEKDLVAGHYKDDLITSMRERIIEDRKDYQERMTFLQNQLEKLQTTNTRYVDELVGVNRRVGQLESEVRMLRMLPAGKPEAQPQDTTSQSGVEPIAQGIYETATGSDIIRDSNPNQPSNPYA